MPPSMLLNLASNMASLFMNSVLIACEIVTSLEGIPHGLGGTNCTRERAPDVPAALVCIVFICTPTSVALAILA